jgi:hypothetical protein
MKKIAVIPWSEHFNNNEIFKLESKHNIDDRLEPFFEFKKHALKNNYEINTIDIYNDITNIDFFFFFKLDFKMLNILLKLDYKDRMFYFAWEPPVVTKIHKNKNLKRLSRIFKAVFTWNDDLVDNKYFFKINYPQKIISNYEHFDLKDKTKLLTMISMDKKSKHRNQLYSERKKIIYYFEKKSRLDFDFYGIRWKEKKYKNYCGKSIRKYETYKQYKFAICFENMNNVKGYVTEKIFDCLKSNIIPIYYGSLNINQYIPSNCYIDYKIFSTIDELVFKIKNMSDYEYIEYINNANNYLLSNQSLEFTSYSLYRNIFNVIEDEEIKMIKKNSYFFDLFYVKYNYSIIKFKEIVKRII